MSSGLWRRIRRLEEDRILPPDGSPILIKIAGGLPDVMHAILGPRWRLDALPGEPLEAFETRVLTAAEAMGEDLVIMSGLPGNPLPQNWARQVAAFDVETLN
jgi:hypothetical protein